MRTGVSSIQEIEDLIRALYPLVYVVSPEEERVEETLRDICRRRNRKLVVWSVTEGFEEEGNSLSKDVKDPVRALENIDRFEDNAIFVMRDFHPYLTDPTIVRRLRDLCKAFTKSSKFKKHVILLSAIFKAPMEIEKDMALVDFDLPAGPEVEGIVHAIWEELGVRARVIATGGLAEMIARHTDVIESVDPFLTLRGIEIVMRRQQRV